MSHHPSASESGLHLDHLEALARAATPGPWSLANIIDRSIEHLCPVDRDRLSLLTVVHEGETPYGAVYRDEDAKFMAAIHPEQVLALIALARRAQPEGEAPQAAPVGEVVLFGRECKEISWAKGKLPPVGAKLFTHPPAASLSPLCGAQHAESEDPIGEFQAEARQAKLEEAVSGWSRHAESGKEALMIEALKSCKASSFRGVDGDWVRSLHYDEGKVRVALAAQQAAAPGAQALLNAEEMAALHRFQETCQDFDSGGYDVDKNMMKRLAAIGVIESKGFGRYQFTDFGDFVIERAAQLDGGQERSESNG